MRHAFTMEYWQDDGWYVGRLKEVPGVFSQGETLVELTAERRLSPGTQNQGQPLSADPPAARPHRVALARRAPRPAPSLPARTSPKRSAGADGACGSALGLRPDSRRPPGA